MNASLTVTALGLPFRLLSVRGQNMWAFCSRSSTKLVIEVNVTVKRQDGLITIISFTKFVCKDEA